MGAPLLINHDIKEISTYLKDKQKSFNFYENYENKNILLTRGKGCVFYKYGKCDIFSVRPLDCRLFPFDILDLDSKMVLVYYSNKAKMCSFSDDLNLEVKEYISIILEILNHYGLRNVKEYIEKTQSWVLKNEIKKISYLTFNNDTNKFELEK